jgi:hypothetical protein
MTTSLKTLAQINAAGRQPNYTRKNMLSTSGIQYLAMLMTAREE